MMQPETIAPLVGGDFVGRLHVARLRRAQTQPEYALHVCATSFVDQACAALDLPRGAVLNVLFRVPDNMLGLLDCPEGWTALAGYVSADLGLPVPSYEPAVH